MIQEYRKKIDEIDRGIIALFTERMAVSQEIAAYKKENGLPVRDPAREAEKLLRVTAESREEVREYTPRLFELLFELSREYQEKLNREKRGEASPEYTSRESSPDRRASEGGDA